MAQLDSGLKSLIESAPQFRPQAWLDREFNRLVYLAEECSYRQDPVTPHLTLLLHPARQAVVGVIVENVAGLFSRLAEQIDPPPVDGQLPLVELVRSAVIKDGEDCTADPYTHAISIVGDTTVPADPGRIVHPGQDGPG